MASAEQSGRLSVEAAGLSGDENAEPSRQSEAKASLIGHQQGSGADHPGAQLGAGPSKL
jgi:hypothetical protein